MSSISFNCDVCGREVFGCNIVNGMRFCAKCYQETFGNTNKDQQIAELKQQLTKYEKDKQMWQEMYKNADRLNKNICEIDIYPLQEEIKQLQQQLEETNSKLRVSNSSLASSQLEYNKLKDDYNKQEELLSEVLADKSRMQLDLDVTKQQLADKDKELNDWKDGTIICKLGELENRLAEKDKEIEELKEKTKTIVSTAYYQLARTTEIIKLKEQLHNQPKEIVKKIEKYCKNWESYDDMGNTVMLVENNGIRTTPTLYEELNEILKEYEEK